IDEAELDDTGLDEVGSTGGVAR
ncbi:MAG: hypothetical protein QOF85_2775, partial [Solirubrobacterales bacterium]|nr:hypothetical protein [Solirubrobacterales bacterium]